LARRSYASLAGRMTRFATYCIPVAQRCRRLRSSPQREGADRASVLQIGPLVARVTRPMRHAMRAVPCFCRPCHSRRRDVFPSRLCRR
jgi:hypothetical protein